MGSPVGFPCGSWPGPSGLGAEAPGNCVVSWGGCSRENHPSSSPRRDPELCQRSSHPIPLPEEGAADALLPRRELYNPDFGCIIKYTIVQTKFKLKQPLMPSMLQLASVSLGFESMDVDSTKTEGRLFYAVLYKGPEHPWILVSRGSWDQFPTDTKE